MRILDESGRADLTIATLCDRVGTTKGSFYHHFGGLPGFVAGLVTYWKAEHTDRLIAWSAHEPDPHARVGVLTSIAVGLPHGAEAAFRAWSLDNAVVAAAQRDIDQEREAHIAQTLRLLGLDRARARRTARMALAMLVGTQQLQHPVDRAAMRAMFRDFDERVLGVPARSLPAPAQRAR